MLSFCQGCLESQWELGAAAAILALQATDPIEVERRQVSLFLIGEHLGQTCGHIHIVRQAMSCRTPCQVSPPAFVVLTGFCFRISYVIWSRRKGWKLET